MNDGTMSYCAYCSKIMDFGIFCDEECAKKFVDTYYPSIKQKKEERIEQSINEILAYFYIDKCSTIRDEIKEGLRKIIEKYW